jgi:hypothetical protein
MALGAVVLVCLLAAPPALRAEGATIISGGSVVESPGRWIAGWLERLAEWLGWGDEELRPVVAPGSGSSSGDTPAPAPTGDCGGGYIPDGAPCHA